MKNVKGKFWVGVASMILLFSFSVMPILASEPVVSVNRITGIPTNIDAGEKVTLDGTIEPSHATYQTIRWSIKDGGGTGAQISGNLLRVPVSGTIVITATIVDGVVIGTSYVEDFVIKVGKSDVQKVAAADAAVRKALESFTPTNTTTKKEMTNLVENAIASTGVTRVSMSWSTNKDFKKVEATTSSEGKIEGQIDLICNQRFTSITLNKVISMLPKMSSPTPSLPIPSTPPTKEVEQNRQETPPISQREVRVKSDVSKVEDVYINNELVDKSDYTIKKETGEIVFKEEFINALSNSDYSVSTRNTDGKIESAIISDVTENEKELNDELIEENQDDNVPTKLSDDNKVSREKNQNAFLQFFVGIGAISGFTIFYGLRKGIK